MSDPVPPALADGPLYLDYNATIPVDPRVMTAMLPYLSRWFANPSSGHAHADRPRRAPAGARAQVAALIGAAPGEIVFTNSGSEADQPAVRGAVLASGRPRPHMITQVTEHPAVLETYRAMERWHRARLTVLPVDADGLLDPGVLAGALDRETMLVSVMVANNETGALQPIPELAALARRHGTLFHCDAAQAAGRSPCTSTTSGAGANCCPPCRGWRRRPVRPVTAGGTPLPGPGAERALGAVRLSLGRWKYRAGHTDRGRAAHRGRCRAKGPRARRFGMKAGQA